MPEEARNELGETALITAAKNGEVGKVKQLLDASADMEATDKWGRTALMWCAREGWIESLRLLVRLPPSRPRDAGSSPPRPHDPYTHHRHPAGLAAGGEGRRARHARQVRHLGLPMGGADQERLVRTAPRRERRQVHGGGADQQRCAPRTPRRPRERRSACGPTHRGTRESRPPFPRSEIDGQMLTIDTIDPRIQIDKAFEHMENK